MCSDSRPGREDTATARRRPAGRAHPRSGRPATRSSASTYPAAVGPGDDVQPHARAPRRRMRIGRPPTSASTAASASRPPGPSRARWCVKTSPSKNAPGSVPGTPANRVPEPDAGFLGDEHDVGRSVLDRAGTAAGDDGGPHAGPLVADPADAGHHPARRQRPREPHRNRSMVTRRGKPRRSPGPAPTSTISGADVLGDVQRQHRAVIVAPPVGVHEVRRPHGSATARTADSDAHVHTVKATDR